MRLAKRANGIFEPEMRLQLMWIPSVITPVALLLMGLGPAYEAHWIVFVLGTGLINLAGPFMTMIILNYAFDCYHGMAPGADRKAQVINHKAAPYIIAAMIIAMSMAFGYVSCDPRTVDGLLTLLLGIRGHAVDLGLGLSELGDYGSCSSNGFQSVRYPYHQVWQATSSPRTGVLSENDKLLGGRVVQVMFVVFPCDMPFYSMQAPHGTLTTTLPICLPDCR